MPRARLFVPIIHFKGWILLRNTKVMVRIKVKVQVQVKGPLPR